MYTQRRNENFGMPGAGSWTCSSNRRLPIQRHGLVARADCLNFAAFLSVHLELEGGSHPRDSADKLCPGYIDKLVLSDLSQFKFYLEEGCICPMSLVNILALVEKCEPRLLNTFAGLLRGFGFSSYSSINSIYDFSGHLSS